MSTDEQDPTATKSSTTSSAETLEAETRGSGVAAGEEPETEAHGFHGVAPAEKPESFRI